MTGTARTLLAPLLALLGCLVVAFPLVSAQQSAASVLVLVVLAVAAAVALRPRPLPGAITAAAHGEHRPDLLPPWLAVDLPRTPRCPRAPGRR